MATVVVVGDVGGCAAELVAALAGVVDDPETVVVQVGDLVDRGPDSAGVLAYVRDRLATAPERWIQLVGNHEAQHLTGDLFWPLPIADVDADLIRTWWAQERLRVAAAIHTADGEELLVTHAGLSVEAWERLGAPVTAATAAGLLNTRPEPLIWDYRGPLWATAGAEVYPSWLDSHTPMPFGQVHGHSSVVRFDQRTWVCGERVRERTTVDWAARHTVTRGSGGRFIGVDPKHGRTGAPAWRPLVLPGASVTLG